MPWRQALPTYPPSHPLCLCSGKGDMEKLLEGFTYGWPPTDQFKYTRNGTKVGTVFQRMGQGRCKEGGYLSAPRGVSAVCVTLILPSQRAQDRLAGLETLSLARPTGLPSRWWRPATRSSPAQGRCLAARWSTWCSPATSASRYMLGGIPVSSAGVVA